MTGLLLVDKPAGFTSFDVIAKLRGVTHTKKIGHSGTLDPMATGVLPLFFGGATKVCSVLQNEDKRYVAGVKFGLVTDTQDTTGKLLSKNPSNVSEEEFEKLAASFVGEQLQTPPMYSAVKVGGRPLYDLARKGKEVERPRRKIVIYSISVLKFDAGAQTAEIEVSCGKGTYIRTLIDDMGTVLGCGAAMSSLRRTEAGGFSIDECLSLDEVCTLAREGCLEEKMLPVERLFSDLPRLDLGEYDTKLYRNGVPLELAKRGWGGVCGDIAVFDKDGKLLGISYMDEEAGELRLRKMLDLEYERGPSNGKT